MSDHSKISIVVPVYNEEKSIPVFLREMRKILSTITDDHEIIFALDPSSDGTEGVLLKECANDSRVKLLVFSRRFGQPAATWAGLGYASGEAIIIIDCDMQDPPNLIPEMVQCWRDEGYKVVIPQRRSRAGENFIKKAVAYAGYWFINKTASVTIPRNTGDFRLIDRVVVDQLLNLNESHGFLRGLTAIVGFKTKLLPFDRLSRVDGKGKYNPFTGSLKIGFNGIVAFSDFLLRAMSVVGLSLAGFSIIAAFIIVTGKLIGWLDFASGVATLGVLFLFLSGCQFIGLGILGAYIGRIYEETKRRPKYIVEKALGFSKEEGEA